MSIPVIWIVIGIVLIVLEIFTAGFFIACVGVSALVTGLFAFLMPENYLFQWGLFALFNAIMFAYVRKIVIKYLYKNKDVKTNIYGIIGKEGIVEEDIDPNSSKGYVKIYGDMWKARSENGEIIHKGEKVIIVSVEGNEVKVKKSE